MSMLAKTILQTLSGHSSLSIPGRRLRQAHVGQNFNEILRAIDALQITQDYGVLTPADWEKGDDTIVSPMYSDKEATEKFGRFKKETENLRLTKDPRGL